MSDAAPEVSEAPSEANSDIADADSPEPAWPGSGERGFIGTAVRKVGPTNLALVLALLILCVVIRTRSDKIFLLTNIINIADAVAIIGVLAVAQMVVVISGGLDISIGSTASLTTVVVAMMMSAGLPTVPSILLALLLAVAAGLINGLVVVTFKISPIIVTLATFSSFAGLAYVLSKGLQIAVTDNFFLVLGTGTWLGIPYPVWVLIAFAILTDLYIRFSVVGRHVYAIGSNENAARNTGISLARYRLGIYAFSGFAAGIAGMLSVASNGLGQASTAGADQGLLAITAALLGGAALTGGRGSVPGAILGVVLLGVLDNGLILMDVDVFYSQVIVGILLITAVGIQQARVFDRMSHRRRGRAAR